MTSFCDFKNYLQFFNTFGFVKERLIILNNQPLKYFRANPDHYLNFQVSYAIQNCSISLNHLAGICHTCNKTFSKERDKLVMTKTAVIEFVNALKFKTSIPDSNFLLLANLVLQVSMFNVRVYECIVSFT